MDAHISKINEIQLKKLSIHEMVVKSKAMSPHMMDVKNNIAFTGVPNVALICPCSLNVDLLYRRSLTISKEKYVRKKTARDLLVPFHKVDNCPREVLL